MTNPKSIGIIGGAGPMASSLLLKYIVTICQNVYGCYEDQDFPKIILINVPFKPMLTPEIATNNDKDIKKQLQDALLFLEPNCAFISIACNTLHAFIDKQTPQYLINMISLTQAMILDEDIKHPLVLGTSTSMARQVHPFKGAIYPNHIEQQRVDSLIDRILKGDCSFDAKHQLSGIINACTDVNKNIDAVVLACTELSVLTEGLFPLGIKLIDPLYIVANWLCKKAFGNTDTP